MTDTFAEAANAGILEQCVREHLEVINDSCRRHPTSPRDAGVADPAAFIADPLRLDSIELVDREEGYLVVSGGGQAGLRLEFYAEDNIGEWVQMDMLENFGGEPE